MAENPKASARLRPIMHEYLLDLAKTGAYGKGKSGVVRRFVENGIMAAVQARVIPKRDVRDFGETIEDKDDDD